VRAQITEDLIHWKKWTSDLAIKIDSLKRDGFDWLLLALVVNENYFEL